ncbi:MAG: UvrD-helicase domain-containing protein [Paludibacter sp.]|nr:UvrD-helicase domain-containing protein [Paludibacter sp.]MDD4429682.1 UvrD-helicase domain-containing protein [Paludibacter sp.]
MIKKRNLFISDLKQSPEYLATVQSISRFFETLLSLQESYISHSTVITLRSDFRETYTYIQSLPSFVRDQCDLTKFYDTYSDLERYIDEWNTIFVKKELVDTRALFDDIDGRSLDEQQRVAVITDEDNELIIAGAGCGKTLTLSGKVQYLLKRKNILPEEILLISYTKKATEELRNRVSHGAGGTITAKTFHKLGFDIITNHCHQRPDVAEESDLIKSIKIYFENVLISDPEKIIILLTFFGSYIHIPPGMEKFRSAEEVTGFYQGISFQTLRSHAELYISDASKNEKQTHAGEKVKSLEELTIANFLYLNGVEYEYERLYPFASGDITKKPYRPDFYLPEYDLYLEHFGVSSDGTVPWLSKEEAEKYIEGMKWKRAFHKKHGTTLLETYSYYNKDGILTEKLTEILQKHTVVFHSRDLRELYVVWMKKKYLSGYRDFIHLVSTFIILYKSNGYTGLPCETLKKSLPDRVNVFYQQRTDLFLKIVSPIYQRYQNYLKYSGKIDFSDMINEAESIIASDPSPESYKYIIIDEYQDTSVGRYRLIRTLREKTGAKIVCVGDDWQSIYKFAGSDIGLFINFEKYFGYSSRVKIENTYRNSQELIDIAGKFVMANPRQIKKELRSVGHCEKPVRFVPYTPGHVSKALKIIVDEIAAEFGENTRVLVLGRTNYDIRDKITNSCIFGDGFSLKYTQSGVFIISEKYPGLTLEFLTVHSAKGIESDNVIILNLEDKILGFPNKIEDDPLLELVLTAGDGFLYAEERRLFYVALTRTRNNVYLPIPEKISKRSMFVCELEKQIASKDYPSNDQKKCPVCGSAMVPRNGKYGVFFGCSRYPNCKGTLPYDQKKK